MRQVARTQVANRTMPPTWSSSTIRLSRFLALCSNHTTFSTPTIRPARPALQRDLVVGRIECGCLGSEIGESDCVTTSETGLEMRKGGFDFINELEYQFGNDGVWSDNWEHWGKYPWTSTSMPGPLVTGWAIRCMRTSGSLVLPSVSTMPLATGMPTVTRLVRHCCKVHDRQYV